MILSKGANGPVKRLTRATAMMPLVMFLGFFVAACAGGDMRTDRQVASDRVNAYLAANPATAKQTADAMRRFKLLKGMTTQQVVAVWGAPKRKQAWRGGEKVQWFFECNHWPHSCTSMGRSGRGTGRSDDEIYPQAFFTNGRLYDWKKP